MERKCPRRRANGAGEYHFASEAKNSIKTNPLPQPKIAIHIRKDGGFAMNERELNREIENACRAVKQAHLDRIQALGVTSATIATLGAVQAPFGVMDCENIGGGIFQPGGDIPHMVQPVYDSGVIIDIVAWRTGEPQSWLWRTGAAWALNTDAIAANSWQDAPLAIDATPLDWLRNGATGLCILNWDAPEIRTLLRVPSITAEPGIARQLRGALMKPAYFPDIQIAEGLRHAA